MSDGRRWGIAAAALAALATILQLSRRARVMRPVPLGPDPLDVAPDAAPFGTLDRTLRLAATHSRMNLTRSLELAHRLGLVEIQTSSTVRVRATPWAELWLARPSHDTASAHDRTARLVDHLCGRIAGLRTFLEVVQAAGEWSAERWVTREELVAVSRRSSGEVDGFVSLLDIVGALEHVGTYDERVVLRLRDELVRQAPGGDDAGGAPEQPPRSEARRHERDQRRGGSANDPGAWTALAPSAPS